MTGDIKDKIMYAVGIGVLLLDAIALVLLFFVPVLPDNNDVLMVAVGNISTLAGLVVGYFYGSSKGSADKTALMAGKDA
jgi:hypothetical protein